MRVAAKHVGLDNVKLRKLFETQPGEVMGWLAATRHQEAGRNQLCSAAPNRQLQHQSRDATQRCHPVEAARLVSVTFFPWTAKTFHIQDWFCSEFVIFVKYRFPASGASAGQSLDRGCAFSDDLPERNGRIKRRARHSNRCRRTLAVFRLASQSDDRRRRNEPKFCLSHRQRAAAARGKAVMARP
jgi:hypothetical protein